MPTLQQIRYLIAVADHLHFRRAAEACHVTQPTLSAQIKELEARLGTQLIERSRSRVLLTPVGKTIADRGRRVLSDVEEIKTLARMEQSPLTSVMRVGIVQTLGSYVLPLVVPDLHETYPKLGLYIREDLPDLLIRQLEEGALDTVLVPLPITHADLECVPLFREPLHLVTPRDHQLATCDVVDPARMKGETVLALEPGHRLYDQVREICDAVQAELSHDFEGTSLDTLRQMVATGIGISLLPALYVKSEVTPQDLVVARPFAAPAPSRMVGMAWRKSSARTREFEELADFICRILSRVAPEVTVLR